MPRMFDILREKAEADLTVSFPREIHQGLNAQKKFVDVKEVSKEVIVAVRQRGIDNIEIAKEKYSHTLEVIENLLEKVDKEEKTNSYTDKIYEIVDSITNQLILGNSLLEIVAFAYKKATYLGEHLINVCILSSAVGIQINFNKSKLHTLATAALLHDLGMLSVKEIIKQPRKLSAKELRQVRNHTAKGVELVSKMEGPYYNAIREIIAQHHERINGQGYPSGLKKDELSLFSQIVGLADTYEAMTHKRAHRQAQMPHQAIRELMGSGKVFFEPEVIKTLVTKISIYPIGSFVKLNTWEIAKVIFAHPHSPLRPVVLVVLDSSGRQIIEPQTLDLSKSNSVYIKEATLLPAPH